MSTAHAACGLRVQLEGQAAHAAALGSSKAAGAAHVVGYHRPDCILVLCTRPVLWS